MKYKHIILTGPSGAGKGYLSRFLFEVIPELALSISATTRPMRENEQNNVHYHFLSEDDFMSKISANEFAEWNHYKGNLYGTLFSEIERIEKANKPILFDVDPNGAKSLKKSLKDRAVSFFLDCSSREERKKRLLKRGTETEEEIEERLKIGDLELLIKHECDYVIPYGEHADAAFTANGIAHLSLDFKKIPSILKK